MSNVDVIIQTKYCSHWSKNKHFVLLLQGFSALVALCALISAASAQSQDQSAPAPAPSSQGSYRQAPAPAPYREPEAGPAVYNFNWQVNDSPSGNNYGQNEDRNGDRTSGSYYVSLPDGRLQKVTYSVDGLGGYRADVTYEGTAQFPAQPAQSYGNRPAAPAPAPASYRPSL